MHTEEEFITAYLRFWETSSDEDLWVLQELDNRYRNYDRESIWRLIYELIKRAPSDKVLGAVAAGPLEDYLYSFQLEVIDQVADAARADKRLQLALTMVGIARTEPIWDRWVELMNEFGFPDVPNQVWIDE